MVKKVKCIETCPLELVGNHLTNGKVYEVIEEKYLHDSRVMYALKGDHGRLTFVLSHRFEEVSANDTLPHNHYFIDVGEFYDSETGKCEVDVYVILEKFGITNPCLQHIAKKALVTGKRGHKNYERDLQDIIDTAEREKVIHSNRK